jgi:hypothetical protein
MRKNRVYRKTLLHDAHDVLDSPTAEKPEKRRCYYEDKKAAKFPRMGNLSLATSLLYASACWLFGFFEVASFCHDIATVQVALL